MKILVIAEHDGVNINAETLATIGAAMQIGGNIDLLICACDDLVAHQAMQIEGVQNVLLAIGEQFKYLLAEDLSDILQKIGGDYTHIMMAATTTGKDCLPYVAAKFDSQQISEITEVLAADMFMRPIYAGNAFEQVQSFDAIKFITVRGTAFAKAKIIGGGAEVTQIKIVNLPLTASNAKIKVKELHQNISARPDLGAAKIVISGGRGLGSADNFTIIEQLADKLDAAIGASRAAVDAGYIANEHQVGQTGRVVAPDLYIAVGISGAIQHLAGMKDSKVIVAINKDENAPIFNVADYGLVGDLFQIMPELIAKL